ncbi:unnamed protein product [Ranitomeya imitator]|uniref:HMG box domain-containing protein n=1 Tax=Ranitomeya imitator TaxID=111125 RepID=A0ABN9L7M7_9NEOB|nr:unnamed protein product [Ranitomeya imitator]
MRPPFWKMAAPGRRRTGPRLDRPGSTVQENLLLANGGTIWRSTLRSVIASDSISYRDFSVRFDHRHLWPKINSAEKRPAPDMGKKPKTPKKKKKKDPNEPQKPVSAYALFFRDTQAAIKGQNPNATFGEVSKIVASMWDGLGEEQKQVGRAYRPSFISRMVSRDATGRGIPGSTQRLTDQSTHRLNTWRLHQASDSAPSTHTATPHAI